MKKDFSFIFHGPYHHEHLNMIEECKKYGEIILSTEKKYINEISKNINYYDYISLYDNNAENFYNFQNMFKHAVSVLKGLKLANNKYCIKFRNLHCYSNLKYIIEKIINNQTDKFICDNITINPNMPYHLSDSIIAGTKETMVGTFDTLYKSILNNDLIYEGIDLKIRSEVAIFGSYLKYKNIKIDKKHNVWFFDTANNNAYYNFPMNCDKYYDFLNENVDLIDIRNLSPFKIKYNHVIINPDHTYKTISEIPFGWYNK